MSTGRSSINLQKVILEDYEDQARLNAGEEVEKIGSLRGGSCGILLPDGNATGTCPRKAALRRLGIYFPVEPDRQIMFEGGHANEALHLERLRRCFGSTSGLHIVGENEEGAVKTEWITDSGITVSGSPDLVLVEEDEGPVLGLELKTICTVWQARDKLYSNRPGLTNLIQSAHYMLHVGCPWKLVYSQYVEFYLPRGKNPWVPDRKLSDSRFVAYKEDSEGRSYPLKLLPRHLAYDLWFEEGGATPYLKFQREDRLGPEVTTPITKDNIVQYYEYVSKLESNLGPRPVTLDCTGEFEGYSVCDYCELRPICDQVEGKKCSIQEFSDRVLAEKLGIKLVGSK